MLPYFMRFALVLPPSKQSFRVLLHPVQSMYLMQKYADFGVYDIV